MSCFFCESKYHLSRNCEIHESDESRKEIVRSKNCCEFCLNYLGVLQADSLHGKSQCPSCIKLSTTNIFINNQKLGKCYTCPSTEHDAVFCPNRFKGPNLFIPNIDQNLLQRFIQIFDRFEQYFLAFSSPKTLNLISLKAFKVIENTYIFEILKLREAVVIAGSVIFHKCDANLITSFNIAVSFERIIFKPKKLVLIECKIFVQEFFPLLSPNIETFYCNDVTFTSAAAKTVTMEEIYKHAPNIEKNFFYKTNGYTYLGWIKNFMNQKNYLLSADFKILISSFEENEKSLAISVFAPPLKFSFFLGEEKCNEFSTEELQKNLIETLKDYLSDKIGFYDIKQLISAGKTQYSILFNTFLIQCFMVNVL